MKSKSRINWWVIVSGVLIGAAAVILSLVADPANPGNMGFCVACFLRDIAGSLGLHSAEKLQYFRPEIVGIVVGALVMALATKEFKAKGGSAPFTRFILGAFVVIGALMFLGCPLRMIIRLGGGDLNALVGLIGFIAGILVGIVFLKKGFSLKRAYEQKCAEGLMFPVILAVLFVCSLVYDGVFRSSTEGPGSQRAVWYLALIIGLIVGAVSQKSRMCMAGGIRDAVMFKDFNLILGFAAIFVTVLVGNLIFKDQFTFSFQNQPVAHSDGLWNFLGMALVGWLSILLGGCPFRQLVLAGQGNSDSAITVLGMIAGAAFCHNFGLAASADGPTENGKIAVIIGFVVALIVSVVNLDGLKRKGK